VVLRFNRRGYRGGDEEPPPGTRRVAVYGDSFVEARLTDEEHTFSARVAAYLAEALKTPFTSVNAGVTGYGPDQELLRIQRELPELRPRLLVVVLYAGNDAGDLVRNGLFRPDGARLQPNDWEIDAATRRSLEMRRGWRALALTRAVSRLREWVRQRPQPLLPTASDPAAALAACRREMEARVRAPRAVQDLHYDHYDADLSLDPSGASASHKRAFLRPLVAALRDTAAEAHVPLLLVIVPHPTDATTTWPVQVDPARFPAYRRSALSDAWAAAAQAEGVPCVDLFPSFWAAAGESLYFPRDGHWNAAGQDRAARLAAERVLAEGWLR
jgi:lysophospholipase L1-like esterase